MEAIQTVQFQCPDHHREIVEYLTAGALMHPEHPRYEDFLKHLPYYEEFYKRTYNASIRHEGEVYYAEKSDRDSKFAANLLLFVAALLTGIEGGRGEANAAEVLLDKEFTADEINNLSRKSAHFRKAVDTLAFGQGMFGLNKLANKGIIRITDTAAETFRFTPAINLFFSFFEDLLDHAESMEAEETEEL